jgi:PhzF family phenazine biosynthesis protein
VVIPLYQIDAFTAVPYRGNPAAVCLLPSPASEDWMQAVAAEMNLSETAFLVPDGDDFQLRWFTPVTEVDLCGHATLASAHALWSFSHLPTHQPARFQTRSGLLTARRADDLIELDFPATPPVPAEPPAGLAEALGVSPVEVGRSRFDYVIQLATAEEVMAAQPDFAGLAQVETRGVCITAPGNDGFDIISRFFAPAAGIDEDPVTGSVHCSLGPWWAGRLGKRELLAFQASKRGGIVRVRLADDRVILSGHAVTVFSGAITGEAATYT